MKKKKHIEKQRLVLLKERIRIISANELESAGGGYRLVDATQTPECATCSQAAICKSATSGA